jgi:hypothetical protein
MEYCLEYRVLMLLLQGGVGCECVTNSTRRWLVGYLLIIKVYPCFELTG